MSILSCMFSAHRDAVAQLIPHSFLAIFADVATIAVAYDRGEHSSDPSRFAHVFSSLRPEASRMATSEGLDHLDGHGSVFNLIYVDAADRYAGLMLAAGTWIIRATLFLKDGGVTQLHGGVQEILFLEVALTESWIICQ